MSFLGGKKTGRRLGVVALAALVGGALACNADREDVMFQVGDFVFNFLVDGTLTGGVPSGSGSIDAFAIAAVDTTVTDALARSTGVLGTFNSNNAFAFPAYSLAGLARNSSTDTRLPALGDDDAAVAAFCVLGSPPFAGVGEGFWDLFCDVANLEPNTRYTVMMVRYSLQVNAELDAVATLLGEPVTQPDELIVAGGAPGGYPTTECNFTVATTVVPDFNPFVLGFVDTDAAGAATIDCVPLSSAASPTWWRNFDEALPAGVEDSIPFAANTGQDGVDLSIPSYNYLVLVEGQGDAVNPVPAGPHVMRWQVGNDIIASGDPVNNGIAPYPTGPGAPADLLVGDGVAGQASALSFTFNNLAALQGSVYKTWLLNEETGEISAVVGDWVATEPDETGTPVEVASESGVSSFNSQPTWTHTFTTSDAIAGMEIGPFTQIFLSIDSEGASSPSGARPVWWKFTDMDGDAENPFGWSFLGGTAIAFGTLNSGLDTAEPWTPAGVGQGGFWGDEPFQCDPAGVTGDPRPAGATCTGGSDLLVVQYRNIQIPPEGYFYESWLVQEDGNAESGGPLQSFEDDPVVSLQDVDVDLGLTEFVSPDLGLLLRATARVNAGDLPGGLNFYDFTQYRLTLTPKAGTGDMPPTTALGNVTPEPLRDRQPEEPVNGGG